jgi:hypothetical protein
MSLSTVNKSIQENEADLARPRPSFSPEPVSTRPPPANVESDVVGAVGAIYHATSR